MSDLPPLLCNPAQFQSGPLGDLVKDYDEGTLVDVLAESTRMCEDDCGGRRLVPFTITETQRASAMDPDEYSDGANMPMSLQGTLGWSQAEALNATNLVRHVWIDQFPGKRYPDMWQYSNTTVQVILSYGGTPMRANILDGPDNRGHIWFTLGQFIPIGSRLRVTYSGGYNPIPRGLVRAAKYMAAYIVLRDLNPEDATHDPDQMHVDAMLALAPWQQDDD